MITDKIAEKNKIRQILYQGSPTDYYYLNEMVTSGSNVAQLKKIKGVEIEGTIDYLKIKETRMVKQLSRFYISRNLDKELDAIYQAHINEKFRLYIDGSRITGKSHAIARYGLRNYDTVVTIMTVNFDESKSLEELVKETVKSSAILDYSEDKRTLIVIDDIDKDYKTFTTWLNKQSLKNDVVVIFNYIIPFNMRANLFGPNSEVVRVHPLSFDEIKNSRDIRLLNFTKSDYKRIGGLPPSIIHSMPFGEDKDNKIIDYIDQIPEQMLAHIGGMDKHVAIQLITSMLCPEYTFSPPHYWVASRINKLIECINSLGILEFEDGRWRFIDALYFKYFLKNMHPSIANKKSACYNDYVIKSSQL